MIHVFQKQQGCAFIQVCALIRMTMVCSANLCGTEEMCVSHPVVVDPELEHTVNIR